MKLVFMGTSDFAVFSLKALVAEGHSVAAVLTQPDRPRGRGGHSAAPPVKEAALALNLPVLQPNSLKGMEIEQELKNLESDAMVVVAYGRILPPGILALPPLGCINLHASLLPRYRGAAPIHRVIMNGEEVTGITTMFMDEGMDTGDIILQREVSIGQDETSGELHDRLAGVGASLLCETISRLPGGKVSRIPQDGGLATYAPPLTAAEEVIYWNTPAREIANKVRGMNPWPVAHTTFRGKVLKIWRTSMGPEGEGGVPGEVLKIDNRKGFLVASAPGTTVWVEEVQPAGKKNMEAGAFLRGYRLEPGEVLGSK